MAPSSTTTLVFSLQQKVIFSLCAVLLALFSWSSRDSLTQVRNELKANTAVATEIKKHLSLIDQAVAVLDNELQHLDQGLASLENKVEASTSDRYRGSDAERDFKLRDQRIDDLGKRVGRLEQVVDRSK